MHKGQIYIFYWKLLLVWSSITIKQGRKEGKKHSGKSAKEVQFLFYLG